jgi:hypothetical protein
MSEETRLLRFANVEVYTSLVETLRAKSVWFEEVGDNALRVRSEDYASVVGLAKDIAESVLPIGRSASFAQVLHDAIAERLAAEGVPFEIRCVDSQKWIIWEAKDTAAIDKVIAQETERFMKKVDPTHGQIAKCT